MCWIRGFRVQRRVRQIIVFVTHLRNEGEGPSSPYALPEYSNKIFMRMEKVWRHQIHAQTQRRAACWAVRRLRKRTTSRVTKASESVINHFTFSVRVASDVTDIFTPAVNHNNDAFCALSSPRKVIFCQGRNVKMRSLFPSQDAGCAQRSGPEFRFACLLFGTLGGDANWSLCSLLYSHSQSAGKSGWEKIVVH